MIDKRETLYQQNITFLKSFVGCEMKRVIQEQFFFEGVLDNESMGTLKIVLDTGESFTFDCDGDAESLCIMEGNIPDKSQIEDECKEYKWIDTDFLDGHKLSSLGKVVKVDLEWIITASGKVQSGCRFRFSTNDFFYFWIIESDNIFYGLNKIPPYHKKNLVIELQTLDK